MEDAIFKWLITVGIPIVGFFLTLINKTKEAERRVTLVEANQRHINEKMKDYATRLAIVENQYAILIRVEEQLKQLSKETKEIKEDVKLVKNDNRIRE